MEALAGVLQAPAVASAMARSSVVDLLGAMLRSQLGRNNASLAAPRMRPGAAALVEAVLRTVSSSGARDGWARSHQIESLACIHHTCTAARALLARSLL